MREDNASREIPPVRRRQEVAAILAAPVSPLSSIRSVRELMCMYKDLRRSVIHGVLREGESLNIISGSKVGKSWLAADLAISVATGGLWFEKLAVCEALRRRATVARSDPVEGSG